VSPDADVDAAQESDSSNDAGAANDAGPPRRDAEPFDAAPLPVVCASPACATSLTTTSVNGSTQDGFCALLRDGTVACWGGNRSGELGRGAAAGVDPSGTPERVVGLTDIVAIDHTCALDKDGAMWCWGYGPFLNRESPRYERRANSTEVTPLKLPIPPATKMALGPFAACAVVAEGVLCWGANYYGQLSATAPVYSEAPLEPSLVALPPGAPIRDLFIGNASFVVREDGTTVSWGDNPPLGRVSPVTPDHVPEPMDLSNISYIDVAGANACAVAGGIPYCWGVVTGKRPGMSQPANKSLDRALPEPVVVPEPVLRIATTAAVENHVTVSAPRWCACGASGAVYCWGNNVYGQVGDGTKDYAFEAVKVPLPGPAAQVKTTVDTTCALLTSGDVYCWGADTYGQLGAGTLKQGRRTPQKVLLP